MGCKLAFLWSDWYGVVDGTTQETEATMFVFPTRTQSSSRLPFLMTAICVGLGISSHAYADQAAVADPAIEAITEDIAATIIDGCKAYARDNDNLFAMAIVDSGGHLLAFSRMDGVSSGPAAFSQDKAKASAIWGFSTSRMENGAKNTPGFAIAPHVVTVAGGVPIYNSAGERIGAFGVSGGAPESDEKCAKAGVAAAGLSTARS